MDTSDAPGMGMVTCAAWIRRPENRHLVVVLKSNPSSLEIFSFDPMTTSPSVSPKAKYEFEEGVNPLNIGVHPGGDEIVCSTTCGDFKLFELQVVEDNIKLAAKELFPLQNIGVQECISFSVDGTKFATGGVDGCLRLFEWPGARIILHEPRAHNSFQDMDFSLDSEFLASTSADGSARIWNTRDGTPLMNLERSADEKIELCRFSKDGTKPFLFCSIKKGNKPQIAVWDISTWKKIGFKRLLKKPAAVMSVSRDGKYLALGSQDGDVCAVEISKMEIRHWSKRLHLGSDIASLEFCPSERVILSTSKEWGVMLTKLTVPADWKEWQIYLLLLGLFMVSLVMFYIFYENSEAFWGFPVANGGPKVENVTNSDQNMWMPLEM